MQKKYVKTLCYMFIRNFSDVIKSLLKLFYKYIAPSILAGQSRMLYAKLNIF